MAIVAASGNGSAPSTSSNRINNGGTVLAGGNVSATHIFTKVIQLHEIADDEGKSYGSKVVAKDGTGAETTDRAGVTKAYAAGTLAYNVPKTAADRARVIVKGYSNTINGVSNEALMPGSFFSGGVMHGGIHKSLKTRSMGTGHEYNIYARPDGTLTPVYTSGTGAGTEQGFVATSGDYPATDDAASVTRALPGELTYHFGGLAAPTNANFKARDSKES